MHFYRRLSPIKAITFDLDDTLYDNRDVIITTVTKTHQALQAWHPQLNHISLADYELAREHIRQTTPEAVHDVTQWRHLALQQVIIEAGLTAEQGKAGADEIIQVFHQWRSAVDLPDDVPQILAQLKQRVPLVAITNGNASPERIGIAEYFDFVLRAGPDGYAKPAGDMFSLAAQRLQLAPENILHVGDDLTTDVGGAIMHGFQACWINDRQRNLLTAPDARWLPHLEISRLDSLTSLV